MLCVCVCVCPTDASSAPTVCVRACVGRLKYGLGEGEVSGAGQGKDRVPFCLYLHFDTLSFIDIFGLILIIFKNVALRYYLSRLLKCGFFFFFYSPYILHLASCSSPWSRPECQVPCFVCNTHHPAS